MRTLLLITALLYSVLLLALFLFSINTSNDVYQRSFILILLGPIVLNWLSFAHWRKVDRQLNSANLTVAVIYSVLLAVIIVPAFSREAITIVIGTLVFIPPLAMNWLTWFFWRKRPL